MYPHQITARAELLFDGAVLDDVPLVSGTVSADRSSTVRRTAEFEVDPALAPRWETDALTPFGSVIRAFRGIRWPNGDVTEVQVFHGRVDAVDFGRATNRVRCSDAAAAIVDARFERPFTASKGMLVIDQMKAIILDAVADAEFDVDPNVAANTTTITTPATWDRERISALDNLAAVIGADWMASPEGKYRIVQLPTLAGSPPSWVVDSGDTGVTITHITSLDRAQIYNGMVVNGEPPDGQPPVTGVAHDDGPFSPTRWGGPFGMVPKFFSSQFITTQAQADSVALSMLGDVVSGARSVEITCVPNPRVQTNDVIYVNDGSDSDWSGMYYAHSLSLPLDPELPMTIIAKTAYEIEGGRLRRRPGAEGGGIHKIH
jgi:hypothetical protein